jgi:hypothetical protein
MFLIQSFEMVTFRKDLFKRSGLDHFRVYAEYTVQQYTEKPVLPTHLIA